MTETSHFLKIPHSPVSEMEGHCTSSTILNSFGNPKEKGKFLSLLWGPKIHSNLHRKFWKLLQYQSGLDKAHPTGKQGDHYTVGKLPRSQNRVATFSCTTKLHTNASTCIPKLHKPMPSASCKQLLPLKKSPSFKPPLPPAKSSYKWILSCQWPTPW